MKRSFSSLCTVVLLLTYSGCKNTQHNTVTGPVEPRSSSIFYQLPLKVTEQTYDGLYNVDAVRVFYEQRNGTPIWVSNNHISTQADSLISMISDARYYGLLRTNYHYDNIISSLDSTSSNLLTTEVLLSDALIEFARDIRYGRTVYSTNIPLDSVSRDVLENASSGNPRSALHSLEPQQNGYRKLKMALKNILDSSSVRDNLISGELDGNTDANLVDIVSVNLHRWRKEAPDLEDEYILINIPSFRLDLVRKDTLLMSSKVIVGKPLTPTPELSSTIECFTIFPFWYVPRKISVEEYLPRIRNDHAFLTKNRFDVLDRKGNIVNPDSIDWLSLNKNNFPIVLRQREGTDNSLGIIKFAFDNPYAVYLHDTNAKRLFGDSSRAYSHGCIRMERAKELAHFLITRKVDHHSKNLTQWLMEGKRKVFEIEPMALHTTYFTCEVREATLLIFEDIYKKDQEISRTLLKAKPIVKRAAQ